jgi:recombination protein RecR
MRFPSSLDKLITLFSRLPSVGPKTAERYVFYLLKQNPALLKEMAEALAELPQRIITCSICNGIGETDPCSICSDPKRDSSQLCVVADSRDMLTIEDTSLFKGYYFVLGGTINTIEGIKPADIKVRELVDRVKDLKPKELILGLDPNLEGETTALYLSKLIKPAGIKVTRLAKGLPSGAHIEYADELTLRHALKFRSEI